jgi:PilZ domain
MTFKAKAYEQRHHVRHQLKNTIFVDIRGNLFDGLATVTDLSKGGLGFESTCKVKNLKGKRLLLDLVFDKDKAILRSLLSQVVFNNETSQHKKEMGIASGKYGLKFVNLSDLDKRLLGLISKKYVLADNKKHAPKRTSSRSGQG